MRIFRTFRMRQRYRVPVRNLTERGAAIMCAVLLAFMGNSAMAANAAEVIPAEAAAADAAAAGADEPLSTDRIHVREQYRDSIAQSLEENGIVVSKTLDTNPDGSLQVELQQYVTGTVSVRTRPVDIVMVLDMSSSMLRAFGDQTTTGIAALRSEASGFVDTIGNLNAGKEDDRKSRIALVKYAWTYNSETVCGLTGVDQDNTKELKDLISGLEPFGRTNMSSGLKLAQEILKKAEDPGRDQAVVLFTDGFPSTDENDGFVISEANRSLAVSSEMKKSGVKVYAVSVDPAAQNYHGQSLPTYELLPPEGEEQKKADVYVADYYGLGWHNTTDENAANLLNRYMHLLCSDNPDVTDMDQPTEGRTSAADGGIYYYAAHSGESLKDAFRQVTEAITQAVCSLGDDAEARDFLTEEYRMDEEKPVRVYTEDYQGRDEEGKRIFGNRREITDEAAVIRDSRSVRVSGFDYEKNCVTDNEDGTSSGEKLVISFSIRPEETFGWNDLATNTEASGIYDGTGEGAAGLIRYRVPAADVAPDYRITAAERVVYVKDSVKLEDLVPYAEGYVPDGIRNRHVVIDYTLTDEEGRTAGTMRVEAGQSAEDCSWEPVSGTGSDGTEPAVLPDGTALHCGLYHLTCRVTPVTEGYYPALELEDQAGVHVLHPVVTLRDSVLRMGEELDLAPGDSAGREGLKEHYVSQTWNCEHGKTSSADVEAPELGYRIAPVNGVAEENGKIIAAGKSSETGSENEPEDIEVVTGVFRLSADQLSLDVTDQTEFIHECGQSSCGYDRQAQGSRGVQFLIHVIPASAVPRTVRKTPAAAELHVVKKDADTDLPLAGAEYDLFRSDDNSRIAQVTFDADGMSKETIRLESGNYYLVETKAPEGYHLSAVPQQFTVSEDHLRGEIQVTVYDEALAVLPHTGGGGTEQYPAAAALLALMSGLAVFSGKAQRRRFGGFR